MNTTNARREAILRDAEKTLIIETLLQEFEVELLRGKGHKQYVLSINDHRVSGMKDGYGYDIIHTFKVKIKDVPVLLETISSTRAERDGEIRAIYERLEEHRIKRHNGEDDYGELGQIVFALEALLEPTGEEGRPKFELVYIKPSDICKCTCHLMGKKDDRYSNIPLKEKAAWYNKCNHCSVPVSEEDKGVNETP